MKKHKISKRTARAMFVVLTIALASTLVSGALLTYFGQVNTTMTTKASVVIGDASGWYEYNEPIDRSLGDVVHCTDYCYKLWIKNQACADAIVSFEDAPEEEGIDICHYVFGGTQTIRLTQKVVDFGNSPWTEVVDGLEAELTFNTCGQTFDWTVTSDDDLSGYQLIYYANYPDYWEGAPAVVLGGLSGTAVAPTMPYVDDENALRPISNEGESYGHQYGAKFWLVPEGAVNAGVIDWSQANAFLFETDLGFYLDCDVWEPICLVNVYPGFATTILEAETTYCWISCYHVAFNIIPDDYSFTTYVWATKI